MDSLQCGDFHSCSSVFVVPFPPPSSLPQDCFGDDAAAADDDYDDDDDVFCGRRDA